MNEWSVWKFIKVGFWLGIGFVIPSLFVNGVATYMALGMVPEIMMPEMEELAEESFAEDVVDEFKSRFDKTAQITIVNHHQSRLGEQLLILGSIENRGDSVVSSIQLEAELFDEEGRFVYECSEYVSQKLGSGEQENFQIKCGCRGEATPEFSTLNVRVVSATAY